MVTLIPAHENVIRNRFWKHVLKMKHWNVLSVEPIPQNLLCHHFKLVVDLTVNL